ncbi:MAG: CopG family transcriptional regulator [Nitrospinae bacterium]|nr:CopG family transcriptional regulator [Nitrospinota bacterium]
MKTEIKQSTIFFEPDILKSLEDKATVTKKNISDLVNGIIRRAFEEDREDLKAFEERKNEPDLDFEEELRKLKKSGKL